MANYNPYQPIILGNEWVPIRDETLILNPFANTLERGYTFTLPVATRINNIRFYAKDWNEAFSSSMIFTASVYPQGQEAASGPVRSVVIPSSAVIVTGTGTQIFPTPSGTDPASALYGNGDNLFLYWILGQGATAPIGMSIFYAVNQFSPLLSGKRILGVDLLIGINVVSAGFEIEDIFQSIQVHVTNDFNYDPVNRNDTWRLADLMTNRTPESTKALVRLHMGDANRFFAVANLTTAGINKLNQWTYPQLQRFEISAANRLQILLTEGTGIAATLGPEVQIEYSALEVFYCEESRILAGSRIFQDDIPNRPLRDAMGLGMNAITVRNQSTLDENFLLPAGTYTVTLSESNMGDNYYASVYRSVSTLNEVRQLYPLPNLPGLQVNIPFPLNDQTVGQTLTSESTALIPQLTMHTSGGTLVDYSHVYGQQAVGQVYGSITVAQDIDDRLPGTGVQFPWVRFYARRFGATTVPLKLSSSSATISGSCFSAQITPADFDALDEIVDGWKQVDLQFGCAPVMGTGLLPTWTWSAVGEAAGNRWEVLGAAAMAVSGYAFQPFSTPVFNQVPTGQRLYTGTYGFPSLGASINEDWMPQLGPYVSSTTSDQAADVTVLFSQNAPAVTGFSVSVTSQALTGIGLNCGIAPCGVPTNILYNQVQWGLPANTGTAFDNFNRVVSGSWGTATDGKVWQNTTNPANSVNGTAGVVTTSVGGDQEAWVNVGGVDQDIYLTVGIDQIPANFRFRAGILGRLTDSSNHYNAEMWYQSTGTVELWIRKRVGGVQTDLANIQIQGLGPSTTAFRRLRFQIIGTTLRAKLWAVNQPEPSWWQLETTDSSLTTGTNAGTFVRDDVTGSPVTNFYFENFKVGPPSTGFGYYELQRSDSITDWQTIMKCSDPGITSFKDYEARTGMSSSYRIRGVNVYGFPGPWSSTASVSLISPGVSGGCFNNGEHVMMFTTNERQDGSSNLAYSNAWERDVEESFDFPEAGFTQLQPMFDKDFYTAFRPSERGGDSFNRALLVQAAAISPATLPGFTSLTDMAWEDTSYICVRDEQGNRWFATLSVPNGVVKNRRRLYLATIQIVEVTDTPSPVDPAA